MNILAIIGFVGGITFGFWQGFGAGKRAGTLRERMHVTAFLLGAHRVAETLAPKDIATRIQAEEHLGWSMRERRP